jgi:alpha-glucosidase
MTLLALPGSTYIYQGDELGLPEVGDLPEDQLQDPIARRAHRAEKGRDGCRVPLPWQPVGPSMGFGRAAPHLPQPPTFGQYAVSVQDADPRSTLSLYRRAIRLRRRLSADADADEGFAWVRPPHPDVLHFARPRGWHCLTNLSSETVELPAGAVVLHSTMTDRHDLPPDTAAWVRGQYM